MRQRTDGEPTEIYTLGKIKGKLSMNRTNPQKVSPFQRKNFMQNFVGSGFRRYFKFFFRRYFKFFLRRYFKFFFSVEQVQPLNFFFDLMAVSLIFSDFQRRGKLAIKKKAGG